MHGAYRSLIICVAVCGRAWADAPAGEAAERQSRPPTLEAQVQAISEFTRQSIIEVLPSWTDEEGRYCTESVEAALHQATEGPLSDEMVAELRDTIVAFLKSNYSRPSPSTLQYQRRVLAWLFRDVVTRPLPTPEGVAALRSQLGDLLTSLGDDMREQLGLTDETTSSALGFGREVWIGEELESPLYRFDRKALSDEEMAGARALLEEKVQAARQDFESLRPHDGKPDPSSDAKVLLKAKSFVHDAIRTVLQRYCAWQTLPPSLAEERKGAGPAQLAASKAWLSSSGMEPLQAILDALLAGAGTAGMPGDATW
jgi:hypothetical protein